MRIFNKIGAEIHPYDIAHRVPSRNTSDGRPKPIIAAVSEPEANERGSFLISRLLHYGGLQSLFLLNARDCGYARMEALGCAVVCVRNCGYARMEALGCAVVCARNCGYARMEDLGCVVVCREELWLCGNGKI